MINFSLLPKCDTFSALKVFQRDQAMVLREDEDKVPKPQKGEYIYIE